jgi:hypothetical protein
MIATHISEADFKCFARDGKILTDHNSGKKTSSSDTYNVIRTPAAVSDVSTNFSN